jgi:drug/metabolite transporter (DMT)-like permease
MILLVLSYLFLATGISANKVILFSLSPEFLVGIRMAAASVLLAGYISIRQGKLFEWPLLRKFFAGLVIIALCTTFFPSNLKAFALAHMPSYKMAYFGTLDPLVAALYSYVWFRERLSWRQWLGMAIGFLGMVILISSSTPFEDQLKAFSIISYPELAACLAMVISRLGWIQAQQFLRKEHMTPLQFNVFTMGISGLLSLAVVYVRQTYTIESLNVAHIPLLHLQPFVSMSSMVQLGTLLGYTTLVGNILGYTLYGYALKRYSATLISLAGFLIPLLVQCIGWLALGEPLSPLFFLACSVTFMGVALFFYDERSGQVKRTF